jgi:hypothetical protein
LTVAQDGQIENIKTQTWRLHGEIKEKIVSAGEKSSWIKWVEGSWNQNNSIKGKCTTGQPTDSGNSAAKAMAMEKRRKLGFMEAFLCYQ